MSRLRYIDRDGVGPALWAFVRPLLPARPPHPLGCHRPRVDDRLALGTALVVLRLGCAWRDVPRGCPGLAHPSSAFRRWKEWRAAGLPAALARVADDHPELAGLGPALRRLAEDAAGGQGGRP